MSISKIVFVCLLAFVYHTKAVHVDYFNDVSSDADIPDEDLLRLILSESKQPDGLRHAERRADAQDFGYRPRYFDDSKKFGLRTKRQVYGGVAERIRELEYELASLEREVGIGANVGGLYGRSRHPGRGFGLNHQDYGLGSYGRY